jgi:hypothetical protein
MPPIAVPSPGVIGCGGSGQSQGERRDHPPWRALPALPYSSASRAQAGSLGNRDNEQCQAEVPILHPAPLQKSATRNRKPPFVIFITCVFPPSHGKHLRYSSDQGRFRPEPAGAAAILKPGVRRGGLTRPYTPKTTAAAINFLIVRRVAYV